MTRLLVPLTVLSSIKIGIFLSLFKGKKSQKDFLIKNETDLSNLLVVKIYSVVALRICV